MYYVYILKLKNNNLYKGSTKNIKRRIGEHKSGSVSATKYYLPVRLVHLECYLLKSDAERREKYLKTTEGRYFLKQQIRDLLKKI